MKTFYRLTIYVLLSFLILCIVSCNSKRKQTTSTEISNTQKSDYEFAVDYLTKLRNDKVDTIIFYKRTCINCCDFYNIFWKTKGKVFLRKIPYEKDERAIQLDNGEIKNDKIFEELRNNYLELKHTSVKKNQHKQKDGTTTYFMVDHYCYTQLSILTLSDSIQTDRIKDYDFDKYATFTIDPKEKKLLNDNYLENKTSKWNLFLRVIEQELASTDGSPTRELQTLRTTHSED